jgi:hypothetical protein
MTTATAAPQPRHPRTGERRQVRRSLQLDRLPPAMLERVCAARAAGQTWIQIEHDSAHWKEWDEVPDEVKKLFAAEVEPIPHCVGNDKSRGDAGPSLCHPDPAKAGEGSAVSRDTQLETGNGKPETGVAEVGLETGNRKLETGVAYRLPHSSLQRWYDLRREQASREKEERTAAAHAAADQLASRNFTDLTAAVKNALGETVFKLMLANDDPQVQIAALTSLARLLLQMDRNQISRERLQIERRRLRLLARKLESEKARTARKGKGWKKEATGRSLTLEDINHLRTTIFGLPPIQRPEPSPPAQPTADLPEAYEPPPPSDDGGVAANPELPSPYPAKQDQTALAGEPGAKPELVCSSGGGSAGLQPGEYGDGREGLQARCLNPGAEAQDVMRPFTVPPSGTGATGIHQRYFCSGFSAAAQRLVEDFVALSSQERPVSHPIPPHPASNHRTRLRRGGPRPALRDGVERGPRPALRDRVEKPAQQREHFDVSSVLRFCGSALGVFSRRSCFPGPARASPMPNQPAL